MNTTDKFTHTLFRVLFSMIFVMAGFKHIFAIEAVTHRLSQTSTASFLNQVMPLEIHVFLAGIVLFVFGLGLLLGSWTQFSAFVLIGVLIPITISVQMEGKETLGPLFKNIALLGGLIYFARFGTQGWSLDHLFSRKSKKSYALLTAKVLTALSLAILFFPSHSLSKTGTLAIEQKKLTAHNMAILVRTPQHLKVAVKTLSEGMQKTKGLKTQDATVVVCGQKGVMALKKDSQWQDVINKATKSRISIKACGLSLQKAGLNQQELSPQVSVVPNGLWEMFRLQKSGYLSVTL